MPGRRIWGRTMGKNKKNNNHNNKRHPKTEQVLDMVMHMITSKDMDAFQINLLNLASLMMLLYTLSRGLSAALPMGLDLTKKGMLPAWSASLLR